MSHDEGIARTYPERLAARWAYIDWKEEAREREACIALLALPKKRARAKRPNVAISDTPTETSRKETK